MCQPRCCSQRQCHPPTDGQSSPATSSVQFGDGQLTRDRSLWPYLLWRPTSDILLNVGNALCVMRLTCAASSLETREQSTTVARANWTSVLMAVRRNVRYFLLFIFVVAILTILTPTIYHSANFKYEPMQRFRYPPDVDLDIIIDRVSRGLTLPDLLRPSNPRIFRFMLIDKNLCNREKVEVLILVKTTHDALAQRTAIRQTWGNSSCFRGFRTRVLFLLGRRTAKQVWEDEQVSLEHQVFGDMVQQDFIDNYYNNTLKMMMGFEFLVHHCSSARFLILVDHDYLVSPPGLLSYLSGIHPRLVSRFLAGYVWYAAVPKRTIASKWSQSRDDYPFVLFPNYAEAGTLIVTSQFARDLYVAMQYTRYHKFDDVFLGVILHKLHIAPVHCPFVMHEKPRKTPRRFLSIHGYDTPEELIKAWEKTGLRRRCSRTRRGG